MKILVGPLQRDLHSTTIFGEVLLKILGAARGHDETMDLCNCYKVKQFSLSVKYFFSWSVV